MKEGERLERDARRIVKETRGGEGVHADVAREIALALEELQRTRERYDEQQERMLEDECTVGTSLRRLRVFAGPFSSQETALRARLLNLEVERRRVKETFEKEQAGHIGRLLELVQRFRLLRAPE